jgi:hypothetical protein
VWASCATHARLVEVQHGEASPAGVDRTKWGEFASKGSTLERRLLFSDGIEMSTFCSSSSFENHSFSLEWQKTKSCERLFIYYRGGTNKTTFFLFSASDERASIP